MDFVGQSCTIRNNNRHSHAQSFFVVVALVRANSKKDDKNKADRKEVITIKIKNGLFIPDHYSKEYLTPLSPVGAFIGVEEEKENALVEKWMTGPMFML